MLFQRATYNEKIGYYFLQDKSVMFVQILSIFLDDKKQQDQIIMFYIYQDNRTMIYEEN